MAFLHSCMRARFCFPSDARVWLKREPSRTLLNCEPVYCQLKNPLNVKVFVCCPCYEMIPSGRKGEKKKEKKKEADRTLIQQASPWQHNRLWLKEPKASMQTQFHRLKDSLILLHRKHTHTSAGLLVSVRLIILCRATSVHFLLPFLGIRLIPFLARQ